MHNKDARLLSGTHRNFGGKARFLLKCNTNCSCHAMSNSTASSINQKARAGAMAQWQENDYLNWANSTPKILHK